MVNQISIEKCFAAAVRALDKVVNGKGLNSSQSTNALWAILSPLLHAELSAEGARVT